MKKNRKAFFKRQKELDELVKKINDKMTQKHDAEKQTADSDSPELDK